MGKSASTRFERSAAALRENLRRRKAHPAPPPPAQSDPAKIPPENSVKPPQ
jgi:hypothetical protein